MIVGGGRMSHRRHRLVRGRPSRIGGLIDASRVVNRDHDEKVVQADHKKEKTMFDSVRDAFEASRRKH